MVFDDVPGAVAEALAGVVPPGVLATDPQLCIDYMKPLSGGALKSLLQKVARFHAEKVDLQTDPGLILCPILVSPAVVAAVAVALLFAHKGDFSPELQLFTRGCTAALKRTAVIAVEDAWVHAPDSCRTISMLLALALATKEMREYEPPRDAVLATIRMAGQSALSNCMIAWRSDDVSKGGVEKCPLDKAEAHGLHNAAALLRSVRSFEGDMRMMEGVAKAARSSQSLKLLRCSFLARPHVMPVCHFVDQHAFRGIGHVMLGGGTTFKKRLGT